MISVQYLKYRCYFLESRVLKSPVHCGFQHNAKLLLKIGGKIIIVLELIETKMQKSQKMIKKKLN